MSDDEMIDVGCCVGDCDGDDWFVEFCGVIEMVVVMFGLNDWWNFVVFGVYVLEIDGDFFVSMFLLLFVIVMMWGNI